MPCPMCIASGGHGQGRSMGWLGKFEWFRCRNCAWEWSTDEPLGSDGEDTEDCA